MPVLKRRHAYEKIYRPSGTKYADGRNPVIATAITIAFDRFMKEFGRMPHQSITVIEVVGVTGDWIATVLEIDES